MLNNQVKIYVTSTRNLKVFNRNIVLPFNNKKQVAKIQRELSLLFGGSTSYNALGSYVMNDNQLVTEKVVIVQSFIDVLNDEIIQRIKEIAIQLKNDSNQESVAIEINNTLIFV